MVKKLTAGERRLKEELEYKEARVKHENEQFRKYWPYWAVFIALLFALGFSLLR